MGFFPEGDCYDG